MKIDNLQIYQYRSIRKFVANLSQRINVFVGSTDSGKSNIIRAIRDLVFNASGTDFVMHGKKKSIVIVNDVTWQRGDGINKYRSPDGVFENVGRTSPDEIRNHLKIDEVNWDASTSKRIQFIEQFEPKFFLSYTSSLNAKILGKVSGIQRIYYGNRAVLVDKKSLNYKLNYSLEELKKIEVELEKYPDLEVHESRLDRIKKALETIQNLEEKKQQVDEVYSLLQDTTKEFKELKNEIKEVTIDENLIDELEQIVNKHKTLNNEWESFLETKLKQNQIQIEHTKLRNEEIELRERFNKALQESNICPLTKTNFYKTCVEDIVSK